MSFLRAEWRKLAIANYEIDPELLTEFLPFGTELDLWNERCYVSLVGFMFKNTRLLGVRIPYHINFEEVNLRFYVKRLENNEWKRGVVFIKEIVPKRALAIVANTVYYENYETMRMSHLWIESEDSRQVVYRWRKHGKDYSMEVKAGKESGEIEAGSETEFITEHYWGYAKVNDRKSNEYQVTHPRWRAYEVQSYVIDVDFGTLYGRQFEFLNQQQPVSVMLAEGSEITVEAKKTIRRNIEERKQ